MKMHTHQLHTHGTPSVSRDSLRLTSSTRGQKLLQRIPRHAEPTPSTVEAQESSHRADRSAANGVPENGTTTRPAERTAAPYDPPRLGDRPVSRRPLLPIVNPQEVVDSVFGTNLSGRVNNSMPAFLKGLRRMDSIGGPVLYKPTVKSQPPPAVSAQLPFLLYLPGIDGTGLAAYRQFDGLASVFDLHALYIPPSDRSSFEQIVEAAQTQLEEMLAGGDASRPVYLLGESFGGLVALELARRCGNAVDRIVLVNPATSFSESVWAQAGQLLTVLPEPIYNTLPLGMSPLISNPFSIALNSVAPNAPRADATSQFLWGLVDLLPELGSLRSVLPAPTLAHRLGLLREGARYVNARLDQVQQRVLLVVGANDLIIPSRVEGPRLKEALPRCRLQILQGRSHAVMQEAGVDMVALMYDAGFYTPRRTLSAPYKNTEEVRRASKGMGRPGSASSNGSAHSTRSAQKADGGTENSSSSSSGSSAESPGDAPSASAHGADGVRGDVDANGNGVASADGAGRNGSVSAAAATAAAVASSARGSGGVSQSEKGGGSASSSGESESGSQNGASSSNGSGAPTARGAHKREVPQGGGANFGKPLPVEMPTPREVDLAMEDGGAISVANLNRLVSPQFFSTDAETGQVMPGLGGVPTGAPGRPVLLVGNHQLFAPDMPLMVVQFLKEKGVLMRGLAHPAVFMGREQMEEAQKSRQGRDSAPLGPASFANSLFKDAEGRPLFPQQERQEMEQARARANPFGSFLTTFGAVPVSPFSLHKLLAQDETIFLFPGGAREALKRKDERYTLIWPEKSEFVRMAARFGATIVPFAAVGAEDWINQVLDSEEVLQLPVIGDYFRERMSNVPQARRGVNVTEEHVDIFAQPLVTFNAPSRFYYAFGRPIQTTPDMANDKAKCEEVYAEVKGGCDWGLSWLLRNRERDPYKDLVRRVVYEYAWGGTRKAPTFSLPGETQKRELKQQIEAAREEEDEEQQREGVRARVSN